MTAATTPDGLRYPDDYQQPADSPNALAQLANDTQAALNRRATTIEVAYMAELVPSIHWSVGPGQMSVHSWAVGTLEPGQENSTPITFAPGSYLLCSVQHSSTYIHAVVQDLGNGTGYIKVRNSTIATTHTNVKVHVLVVHPPAG